MIFKILFPMVDDSIDNIAPFVHQVLAFYSWISTVLIQRLLLRIDCLKASIIYVILWFPLLFLRVLRPYRVMIFHFHFLVMDISIGNIAPLVLGASTFILKCVQIDSSYPSENCSSEDIYYKGDFHFFSYSSTLTKMNKPIYRGKHKDYLSVW